VEVDRGSVWEIGEGALSSTSLIKEFFVETFSLSVLFEVLVSMISVEYKECFALQPHYCFDQV